VIEIKAVIPAAGLGTRFLPITKAQPKEMLPVFDKPTIQYVIEEVVESEIDDILIITGRGKRAIEDHFDRSFELESTLKNEEKERYLEKVEAVSEMADIHYIRQKAPKGLGHAIMCARKFVDDEPFAVLLGDTITRSKVPCTKQLIEKYRKYEASIIAVEKVDREKLQSYGIIGGEEVDRDTYLVEELVEKPRPEEAPSDLGIIGRYILTPEVFDCIKDTKPGVGGEIQLTDALNMLKERQSVYGHVYRGRRYDIGNMLDWLIATIEFGLEDREVGPKLKEFMRDTCAGG